LVTGSSKMRGSKNAGVYTAGVRTGGGGMYGSGPEAVGSAGSLRSVSTTYSTAWRKTTLRALRMVTSASVRSGILRAIGI
jgi:hypothetical protein